MASKFVLIEGSEEASNALRLELGRLSDEAAVLRDSVAALAADRDRLRAETKELRAELKRAAALNGAALEAKKKGGAKRTAQAGRPPLMMQYGALPYRVTAAGTLELLLVTTRQSKRWIVPKGRRIKGLTAAKCAAREAFEEAGVRGVIEKKPIGAFRFVKTVDDALGVMCEVRIFALRVKRELPHWPEAPERTPRWFEPSAALAAVTDSGLKSLISRFVDKMDVPPRRLN
jgi:8-oxo-dGTP pyrophosphatase MutT (NUDIX family)